MNERKVRKKLGERGKGKVTRFGHRPIVRDLDGMTQSLFANKVQTFSGR